jgi:hypothetical protein
MPYAKLDPLLVVDGALKDTRTLDRCCCCCSPGCGLRCALGLFIWEAVWHIAISIARPLWEWTSTGLTIFAFVLQDCARAVLLVLSVSAWRALSRGQDGAPVLRTLIRGLFLLACLEAVEMVLKFGEVHAVCNAPEVLEAHLKRAQRYNLTGFNMTTGYDGGWCEMFSDVYDFGWGLFSLFVLLYVIRVVHSYLRLLKQPSPEKAAADSSYAEHPAAVEIQRA